VEDDPAARRAISQILRRQGFAVSEACTVADAIAGLAQRPAWMLLDLMLPDGNGIDVLRRARSEQLPVTVCVITGCGCEMIDEACRAGADHSFTKPLDVRRLMALMTA
jgi:DNA-binding response OmpR family regulator